MLSKQKKIIFDDLHNFKYRDLICVLTKMSKPLHMKLRLFCLLLTLFILLPTLSWSQVSSKQTLNEHWRFYKGSLDSPNIPNTEMEIVNLPHTWNANDVLADGHRGYYRGQGWYFKSLEVNLNTKSSYFIQFEGANQKTVLYVNGLRVGEHIGGYSGFTFDITEFLTAGTNQLAVMVNNEHDPEIPPLSADFTFFGGIYRDVFLVETGKVHFNLMDYGSKGFYIHTPKVTDKTAILSVRGELRNSMNKKEKVVLSALVYDNEGNPVVSKDIGLRLKDSLHYFELQLNLDGPKLWSTENPYLYKLELQLKNNEGSLDIAQSNFGIRTIQFDPKNGFYLNGMPLKLIGANRHQDFIGKGNALPDDLHRSDLRLLKEMGANFLRLAHYPQDPSILEEADRLGILVWEETPLVNEITLGRSHEENAMQMLREMIRQHYNHPSIILWGYMNEIYWAHRFLDSSIVDKHTKATVSLAKKMDSLTRAEDPTRYTAMAMHNYPLYEQSGIDQIPQVVGWNLYHGWYYDTFADFGRFLDEQHRKYPERIHLISEFGAGSDIRLHSEKPERFDFTIEGQKRMLESYLKQIYERPFIAGATVWNLIDFSSERRVDTKPHINQKGITNADRTPKDPFYLFQAYLSKVPFAKIAERNHTDRTTIGENTQNTIDVYTNQSYASLFLNGEEVERQFVKNYKASFEVVLKEGENLLELEAGGASDRLVIENKIIDENFKTAAAVELHINAGSNHSFYDSTTKTTWVIDQPYSKGSWGFIGGRHLYVGNKIGTKEDIQTIDELTPLYQTMREGDFEYRFDVPDGWYELELLFVEPYPKSRRFVDGVESPYHPGDIRVFDVILNNKTLFQNLDLLKNQGYNYPMRKRIMIKCEGGKGVNLSFKASKGESILSALSLRGI